MYKVFLHHLTTTSLNCTSNKTHRPPCVLFPPLGQSFHLFSFGLYCKRILTNSEETESRNVNNYSFCFLAVTIIFLLEPNFLMLLFPRPALVGRKFNRNRLLSFGIIIINTSAETLSQGQINFPLRWIAFHQCLKLIDLLLLCARERSSSAKKKKEEALFTLLSLRTQEVMSLVQGLETAKGALRLGQGRLLTLAS